MKATDLIVEAVRAGAQNPKLADALHEALQRGAALRDRLEPINHELKAKAEEAKVPYVRARGFFKNEEILAEANAIAKTVV